MFVAEAIVWFLAGYFAIGIAVAVPFVLVGVGRIDPAAVGTTWGFRAAIFPGCVGLWPWTVLRSLRSRRGVES